MSTFIIRNPPMNGWENVGKYMPMKFIVFQQIYLQLEIPGSILPEKFGVIFTSLFRFLRFRYKNFPSLTLLLIIFKTFLFFL